jgi:hypothetical protein
MATFLAEGGLEESKKGLLGINVDDSNARKCENAVAYRFSPAISLALLGLSAYDQ